MEKRRQALQEAERRELERRAQKQREEQERREKEAREAEERRRKEEEKRLERLRELERQREEERQREIERKEVNLRAEHSTDCGVKARTRDLTLFLHILARLHSGSLSARGRRSGRGGDEESSR